MRYAHPATIDAVRMAADGVRFVHSWPSGESAEGATSRGGAATGVLLGLVLLAACAALQPRQPGLPWESPLGRDHPLTGYIWDVGNREFLNAPSLIERLARGRFILLGERHDNPDHHRLQAWVLRALIAAGRRPAVGFEMLGSDDAEALARYLATLPADAAGLGAAVGWDRTGWPPWPLYQPIADAALALGVPIVAANLSSAMAQAIARRGMPALDAPLLVRLRLDAPLAASLRAEMAAEILESHCHMLPEAMLDNMIAAQRARDAQMAERLATAGQRDGAVLIAGNGHVRKDRGVPAFLALQAPAAPAISVAFLEIQRQEAAPDAYASSFGRGPLPVDYVWFTPRRDDVDPCEKFRAPLERLRRGRPE